MCHRFGELELSFVALCKCSFWPSESIFKKVMYTTTWTELINVLFAKEARYKSTCCIGSIFIKRKNRPSGPMLLKVRLVPSLGVGVGHRWASGFLVMFSFSTWGLAIWYDCEKSLHCTLAMCTFFYHVILLKKVSGMSCFKQILRAVALMYIFSYLLQSAGVKKYDRLTFKPSVAQ